MSTPCLATLLSPAKGQGWGRGSHHRGRPVEPHSLLETGPTLGPLCAKPSLQNVAAPRRRAACSPPRLSCLPVVAAAGKCFSSDRFQSCHSVIPCATRQKTPPRPSSPAHLFPCTLFSCSRSLTAFQGNHRRCNRSSGIFFFSFPQVLNHPYYPFLIN